MIERPDPEDIEQHFCADKGYDYDDVHQAVEEAKYVPHIKHRRRRNEPPEEECPIPGETQYPARRWVVERTISWLGKRRSIRIRWCKSLKIGMLLSSLLVLTFCSIWHFTDRLLFSLMYTIIYTL